MKFVRRRRSRRKASHRVGISRHGELTNVRHIRWKRNPLSTSEYALIAGGVVAVGVVGYLLYSASKASAATATANPLNQPITYGQITGATPMPSLLAPGFQGQATGPAPAASTNAPVSDGSIDGTS